MATLPQVAAATGERIGSRSPGKVEHVAAIGPGRAVFDVSPVQGSIGALGADAIAVYSGEPPQHLTLGSPVPVLFKDTGPQTLRVALIYGETRRRRARGQH